MKKALLAMTALALESGFIPEIKEEKPPKNKFNLTNEEIIKLESMTPKEKKKYLKERK